MAKSWFSRLFNRDETPGPAGPVPAATVAATGSKPDVPKASAYVMLGHLPMPTVGAVTAALKRRVPDLNITNNQPDDNPVTSLLCIGASGAFCPIMFVDAPNPLGPNESFIQAAWWWPNAAEAVQHRKGHVIVFVSGVTDVRERYRLLSAITAAVLDVTSSAIGVIWETADALWPAEMFRGSVDHEPGKLAVPLMVSVKISRDTEFPSPDGSPAWLGMTFGLRTFDMMELEVRGWSGEPQQMIATMVDVSAYLLDAGAVIKDGDTMGPVHGRHFQVRHQPSTLEQGRRVYRMFPQSTL